MSTSIAEESNRMGPCRKIIVEHPLGLQFIDLHFKIALRNSLLLGYQFYDSPAEHRCGPIVMFMIALLSFVKASPDRFWHTVGNRFATLRIEHPRTSKTRTFRMTRFNC